MRIKAWATSYHEAEEQITKADSWPKWIELSNSGAAVLNSRVTVAELWAGGRPDEHKALNNLFRALTCAPADEETGHRAGQFVKQYRRSHGIEIADALIVAGAMLNGAQLWMQNRKHYPMKDLFFFD